MDKNKRLWRGKCPRMQAFLNNLGWFEDARGFKNLEQGLKKIGFQDTEVNDILGNNWYNFYRGIND